MGEFKPIYKSSNAAYSKNEDLSEATLTFFLFLLYP